MVLNKKIAMVAAVIATSVALHSTALAEKAVKLPAKAEIHLPQVVGLPDFTQVVKATENGVVNIRTMSPARSQFNGFNDDFGSNGPDEFFRFFFGPNFQSPIEPRTPRSHNRKPKRDVPSGVGSGFIISEDGYIITNNHVVEDTSRVIVTLNNGKEYDANVIGTDERTDLALLKIDTTGLQALSIGDSDHLKKGQWVLAIGSPYDLESTVTAGIISAINRDTGNYLPFIQTDVAINPGNSGGPLLDLRGRVIGVNSQIYTQSGGSMGISFSIPITEAMRVIEQIKTTGVVQRGRIGIMIGEVQEEVADALGLPDTEGALVSNVEEKSPAEKAGILSGDVILKFDGEKVVKWTDLPRMVGQTKPGKETTVEVWRRGKLKELDITIEKTATDAKKAAKLEKHHDEDDILGLAVSNLSNAKKKELRLQGGILIDKVRDEAQDAGILKGDILLTINDKDIDSVKTYKKVVGKLPKDKAVALLIRRNDLSQWVTVTPEK